MKVGGLPPLPSLAVGRNGGGQEGGSERPLALVPGRLLRGRVLAAGADGRVVLELEGQQLAARSTIGLRPGSEVWLEVKQGAGETWLALADKKGAALELLQSLLAEPRALTRLPSLVSGLLARGEELPPELRQPLERLSALLRQTAQGPEPRPAAAAVLLARLQEAATGKGAVTGLEAELADLLSRSWPHRREEAPERLARSLRLLEAVRQLNQHLPARHQPLFWLMPCWFQADQGGGSWLLELEKPEGTAEESYAVSFFLEMSQLGEVRIRVTVAGSRLRGRFGLAEQAGCEHLRRMLPALGERLARLGYPQAEFTVSHEPRHFLRELQETVAQAAGLAGVRVVDVTA